MKANPVFSGDQFSCGGDHTPFHDLGFAAIRFTTPLENYANQHSPTDTFENASPSHTARVVRVNAAAAASVALAPAMPEVMRFNSAGVLVGPSLTRGKGRATTRPSSRPPLPRSTKSRVTASASARRSRHIGNAKYTSATSPSI